MLHVTPHENIAACIPGWVPKDTRPYLAHTQAGTPLRALARAEGVHASTILRQVRAVEARREDVLVDRCLDRLGQQINHALNSEECGPSYIATADAEDALTETHLSQEACRILGQMSATGAVMAVVMDMEKAVVVRETASGDTTRRAILSRDVAEAMALNGWISCDTPGRILKYRITAAGRAALGRFLARAENKALGFSDDLVHPTSSETAPGKDHATSPRFQSPETPLALLARRRDREGRLFLAPELVGVGERLHEDFVLSGLPVRKDETWDQFLCRLQDEPATVGRGALRARDRMVGALRDLGPGLGDAVLRCCCCLEGLELTEKRMGWSARSGKVVLRIALQRLRRHYAELGEAGALVG